MSKFLQICICGGGSLAHTLIGVIGSHSNLSIRLLTRRPENWKKEITINYRDIGILRGKLKIISNDPEETLSGADLVLITVPSFAYYDLWNTIKQFVSKEAIIGALPGNGGFEWIVNQHIGIVFGMQRVPYVCRTEIYGQSVLVSGVRKEVFIATRPSNKAKMMANMLESLLKLKVSSLPNYLNVSLVPANPIFHSVRNYSLFQQSNGTGRFITPPLFYEEWDNLASDLFLQCDEEIQTLIHKLPLDLSGVKSIRSHYHSNNATSLSKTIRNIESLKGIKAPTQKCMNYWSIDYMHRFFTEDMLINLPVILYFAELVDMQLPGIKKIFNWGKEICEAHGIQSAYDVCSLARKAGVVSTASISNFYI